MNDQVLDLQSSVSLKQKEIDRLTGEVFCFASKIFSREAAGELSIRSQRIIEISGRESALLQETSTLKSSQHELQMQVQTLKQENTVAVERQEWLQSELDAASERLLQVKGQHADEITTAKVSFKAMNATFDICNLPTQCRIRELEAELADATRNANAGKDAVTRLERRVTELVAENKQQVDEAVDNDIALRRELESHKQLLSLHKVRVSGTLLDSVSNMCGSSSSLIAAPDCSLV